jgi:hypothetical protein
MPGMARLGTGDFTRSAIIAPILRSRLDDSFLIVASAKLSQSVEESVIETTGVREPDARIRKVNLSLLSVGMEWPRRTRSKSPSLIWAIASLIDPVDVKMNPADCQTEL